MQTINRVGVLSLAKVLAVLYALFGLIFGALMAAFSLIGAGFAQATDAEGAWVGALFGVGAVILLPILYGVMGFVGGALTAFLYNICSGIIGGVEIEVR